jgi:hypothetical protein
MPLFELLGPPIDFALGRILGVAVPLLKQTEQFVPLAFDGLKIVVRQLAPLRPDLAFELLPVSFDFIPVHDPLLFPGVGCAIDAHNAPVPPPASATRRTGAEIANRRFVTLQNAAAFDISP